MYANIDGFSPNAEDNASQLDSNAFAKDRGFRPAADRGELDRWILSELHQTLELVVEQMDNYDNYGASARVNRFVDALSNWYVRRSRDRFWASDKEDPTKLDAYWTLYECLVTTCKMVAPFVPFLADAIWQNLKSPVAGEVFESVHLCDYPTTQPGPHRPRSDSAYGNVSAKSLQQGAQLA